MHVQYREALDRKRCKQLVAPCARRYRAAGDAFEHARCGRGHRMLRQWEGDSEVCSFYEMHLETSAGAGAVLMSEWNTVRDGKLVAGRLVFDTAAFNALVPAAGESLAETPTDSPAYPTESEPRTDSPA